MNEEGLGGLSTTPHKGSKEGKQNKMEGGEEKAAEEKS